MQAGLRFGLARYLAFEIRQNTVGSRIAVACG